LIELLEGEVIEGFLCLYGCTSLTHLPNGLEVGWSLNLDGCTSLTQLPDGLKVGENLHLPDILCEMEDLD